MLLHYRRAAFGPHVTYGSAFPIAGQRAPYGLLKKLTRPFRVFINPCIFRSGTAVPDFHYTARLPSWFLREKGYFAGSRGRVCPVGAQCIQINSIRQCAKEDQSSIID